MHDVYGVIQIMFSLKFSADGMRHGGTYDWLLRTLPALYSFIANSLGNRNYHMPLMHDMRDKNGQRKLEIAPRGSS